MVLVQNRQSPEISSSEDPVGAVSHHVEALCAFTGLSAQALAGLLHQIPETGLRRYSTALMDQVWPHYLPAKLAGNHTALNAPDLRNLLLCVYAALYCDVRGQQPAQLRLQALAQRAAPLHVGLPACAADLMQGIAELWSHFSAGS